MALVDFPNLFPPVPPSLRVSKVLVFNFGTLWQFRRFWQRLFDPRLSALICGNCFPLPCGFVQQNRCSNSRVQRLYTRRMGNRDKLIGKGQDFLGDTCSFIAHHDHGRAGEVGFMERFAFV